MKLTVAGAGQYWGGGPPGKPFGCCWLFCLARMGLAKSHSHALDARSLATCASLLGGGPLGSSAGSNRCRARAVLGRGAAWEAHWMLLDFCLACMESGKLHFFARFDILGSSRGLAPPALARAARSGTINQPQPQHANLTAWLVGTAPTTHTFASGIGYASLGLPVQLCTLYYSFSDASVGVAPIACLCLRAFRHNPSKKYAATSHSALERGYDVKAREMSFLPLVLCTFVCSVTYFYFVLLHHVR